MNPRTTLVLLFLVGGLFVAWTTLVKGGPGELAPWTGQPFFPNLAREEIDRIDIQDASGERTSLQLHRNPDGEWMIRSPGIEEGRPVRALSRVVEEVIVGLQSVIPQRVIDQDPEGQAELDLGLGNRQRLEVTALAGDRPLAQIQIGANGGVGEVLCRASTRSEVFAIPKEVVKQLVPAPEQLEDRALLRLNVLDVRRIRVEGVGLAALDVERGASRWFLKEPFAGLPADDARCDSLRSELLGIEVLGRAWGERLPAESTHRVRITTDDGRERVIQFAPAETPGQVLAWVDEERPVIETGATILASLGADRGLFRNRNPLDEPANRLGLIELRTPTVSLQLRRIDERNFQLTVPGRADPGAPMYADEADMGSFLSRLRSLEFSSYGQECPSDWAPESELRVGIVGAGSDISKTLQFGPPDGQERELRVLGEERMGACAVTGAAFLTEPFWTLLERRIRGTFAYFRLGRIELTNDQGTKISLRGEIPGERQDLKLYRAQPDGTEVLVDEERRRTLVHALIDGFTIREWIGEERSEEMGFDHPALAVRWFEPDGASAARIPMTDKGTWRNLLIGSRRADGLSYGVVDGGLGVVFLVDQASLAPFISFFE